MSITRGFNTVGVSITSYIPSQVVELPKENPQEALQLFADVPKLQVLVMGGDGTAGWILGCLDQIQEERADTESGMCWFHNRASGGGAKAQPIKALYLSNR